MAGPSTSRVWPRFGATAAVPEGEQRNVHSHDRVPPTTHASPALCPGAWHLVLADSSGSTRESWHLFAIFAAAYRRCHLESSSSLTSSLLAVAAAVLTRTVDTTKAFAGFANQSVLLVVVAFLVANAVVKSDSDGASALVVSAFGRSTLGLGYSIFVTDAMIAPAFPSNTARGGVLYPIILSLSQNFGSMPEDEKNRRMGGYLCFVDGQPQRFVRTLAHRHLRQSNRSVFGGAHG